MSQQDQMPASVASGDLSEELHITLSADGTAMLECVDEGGEVSRRSA